MIGLTLLVLLSAASINAQDSFSPQLQEAIDFCGGLQSLTDGQCPPQPPVDASSLKKEFSPAKNIKLCSARYVIINGFD